MSLHIDSNLLAEIHARGEEAYPEEGAGFLLGTAGPERTVKDLIILANAREDEARRNRYLIGPEDYWKAELEAERRKLDLVGVFHSHPDHPNRPSDFDREWAQPFFTYVITSVELGKAVGSRAWRLADDRTRFDEVNLSISR